MKGPYIRGTSQSGSLLSPETNVPQPTKMDRNVGRVLKHRFRLDEPVGSGSMGVVYRGWDLDLEQPCAVKLLHLGVARREAVLIRFCDEARIIAGLYHPNIVELLDFGQEPDGSLFLAMEYLRGQDLHCLLQKEVRLSLPRTLELVRQIGSALHYVHLAGVIHRDIKPRNIILTQSAGDTRCAKVIDFGLSKVLDAESRGSDGLLIGTPEYLPPEAWSGYSSDVDTRADQWALAVLTYRLLSGRLPFEARDDTVLLAHEIRTSTQRPLRELAHDVPLHVEEAITRALAKDKSQRFASVSEFVRVLSRLPLSPELPRRPAAVRMPGETLATDPARLPRAPAEVPPSTQLALPLSVTPETALLPTLGLVSPASGELRTRLTPQRIELTRETRTALRPLLQAHSTRSRVVLQAARWITLSACASLLGWCSHSALSASIQARQVRQASSQAPPHGIPVPVQAVARAVPESPPLCIAPPVGGKVPTEDRPSAAPVPARVFTKIMRKRAPKGPPSKGSGQGPQNVHAGAVSGPPLQLPPASVGTEAARPPL